MSVITISRNGPKTVGQLEILVWNR